MNWDDLNGGGTDIVTRRYEPATDTVPLLATIIGIALIGLSIMILLFFYNLTYREQDWRKSYWVVAWIINSIMHPIGSGGTLALAFGLPVYVLSSLFIKDDSLYRKSVVNMGWLAVFVANGSIIGEAYEFFISNKSNVFAHLIMYGDHPIKTTLDNGIVIKAVKMLPNSIVLGLMFIVDLFTLDFLWNRRPWHHTITCYLISGCAIKYQLAKKKAEAMVRSNSQTMGAGQYPTTIDPVAVVNLNSPPIQQVEAVQQKTDQLLNRFQQARAERTAAAPKSIKPPNPNNPLVVCIGDHNGKPLEIEIRHMSIAGASEMGKTTFIWKILCDLILHSPRKVQLILSCAKQFTSFQLFEHLPHVMMKVKENSSVEFTKLVNVVFDEYTRRFTKFTELRVSNIFEYNKYSDETNHMPHIFVVIDEMSHLTGSVSPDIVEQFANQMLVLRAAGIYVILGAQDPSAQSLPLKVRGNLQTRIAVPCTPGKMSEIAIGRPGADKLRQDKLEAILVSMRDNTEGQAIKFTRPRITESYVWQCVQQSEKMFGYDKEIKAKTVEALKRRRNSKTEGSVKNNVIPLNNLNIPRGENTGNNGIFPTTRIFQPENNSDNVVQTHNTGDTQNNLDVLFEMLSKNHTQEEIAATLGCTQSQVSKLKNKAIDAVKVLIAQSKTARQIAMELGCSPKTVISIHKYFKESKNAKTNINLPDVTAA